MDLERFVKHYLDTALWSSTDENGEPLDTNYSIEDIMINSITTAKNDCELFVKEAGEYLDNLNMDRIAHDFWLTRNRHGAGFWDGDYQKETGEFLTKLSHSFGECDLYIGDNGSLYLS